mgnify:CR=1 FL=1|jgi:hypothetical protein
MDLLTSTKIYCNDINESSYVQRYNKYNKETVYQDINNLFIDKFDPTCHIIEEKDKDVYFIQRLLEIATDIDEKETTCYNNYNYAKQMKSSIIQSGLQVPNTLSSVIYLGDIYKVTPVIYIDSIQKKVITSKKTRNSINILYRNGTFMELVDCPDFKEGVYDDLKVCLCTNIKNLEAYATHLESISKYKSPELVDKAKSVNIPIESNGKKKVKKQLYDEINMYYLNNVV